MVYIGRCFRSVIKNINDTTIKRIVSRLDCSCRFADRGNVYLHTNTKSKRKDKNNSYHTQCVCYYPHTHTHHTSHTQIASGLITFLFIFFHNARGANTFGVNMEFAAVSCGECRGNGRRREIPQIHAHT